MSVQTVQEPPEEKPEEEKPEDEWEVVHLSGKSAVELLAKKIAYTKEIDKRGKRDGKIIIRTALLLEIAHLVSWLAPNLMEEMIAIHQKRQAFMKAHHEGRLGEYLTTRKP
jgi:hypothetical protein